MHIQWGLLGCLASVSATNICCTSGCRLTSTLIANNNNALVVLGHETLDVNSLDTECKEAIHTVTLSNGVTAIGSNTFYMASDMTDIDVSTAVVTSIGAAAFIFCISLQTVTFPDITTIGSNAFTSCFTLTSARFHSVTSIAVMAFVQCQALSDLYIGTSGATIHSNAFLSSFLVSEACYNAPILSNTHYDIVKCTNGTDAPSLGPTAAPTVTATTVTATTTVNASTAVSTTADGGDSSPTTASSPQDTVVLVTSLVVIGIIIGGVLYASSTPAKKSSTKTPPTQTSLDL